MVSPIKPIPVRLPDDLKASLTKIQARDKHKSFHATLIAVLQEAVGDTPSLRIVKPADAPEALKVVRPPYGALLDKKRKRWR